MVDLVKLEELRKFLDGSGQIEGVSFGEKPTTQTAPFWWRKHLTAIDEAKAEIERLNGLLNEAGRIFEKDLDSASRAAQKEIDGAFDERNFARQDLEAANAEIERLREALKVFAELAQHFTNAPNDGWIWRAEEPLEITVGDLRHAARALGEKE